MLTLLRNLRCYSPDYLGLRDILIANGRIFRLTSPNELTDPGWLDNVMNCDGMLAFPGLIDQHVHIIGGGGEDGFASRISELDLQEILSAGVTTLVGLLGADGCTRSLFSLYAKARMLEARGISAYMYSGSYTLPPVTLTGNLQRDILLVDRVIGAGEIAISDHRSSQPDGKALLHVASEAHLGGMLSGKAGVVHLHVGDGKTGLKPLLDAINGSDLPAEMFIPTHVNRNPSLFNEAIEFCRNGGNIDLTAGETAGIPVRDAVCTLIDEKIDLSHVTVSSDANGSTPGGGCSKIQALYDDLISCIVSAKLAPETIFSLSTINAAKVLKLYPRKGALMPDSDADILITDSNYHVQMLFCAGNLLLNRTRLIV